MDEHVLNFEVLFTAQKLKKFKTWQDGKTLSFHYYNSRLLLIFLINIIIIGTMKYYSFNKKVQEQLQ